MEFQVASRGSTFVNPGVYDVFFNHRLRASGWNGSQFPQCVSVIVTLQLVHVVALSLCTLSFATDKTRKLQPQVSCCNACPQQRTNKSQRKTRTNDTKLNINNPAWFQLQLRSRAGGPLQRYYCPMSQLTHYSFNHFKFIEAAKGKNVTDRQ